MADADRGGDDSTAAPVRYEITLRGNALWVKTTEHWVEAGLDPTFDLAPAGGDTFHPRQYKNGTVVGIEADEPVIFRITGGRAVGFEKKGMAEDKVLAPGRRQQ